MDSKQTPASTPARRPDDDEKTFQPSSPDLDVSLADEPKTPSSTSDSSADDSNAAPESQSEPPVVEKDPTAREGIEPDEMTDAPASSAYDNETDAPAETPAAQSTFGPASSATAPPAHTAEFMSEQPLAPTAMAPVPPKGKRKGLMIGLIIGVVLLVLGGGAAAAYFGYYLPNKPENILKQALYNDLTTDAPASKLEGEFSVKQKDSDETFAGTVDAVFNENGSFDMTATLDALVTTLSFDVRSVDGKSLYARVGGLEGLPEIIGSTDAVETQSLAALLEAFNDQWFEINNSLLQQATDGSFKSFDFSNFSEKDAKKVADLYAANSFFVVKQTLADEKASGVDSYHYKVAIDRGKLINFLKGVKDAKIENLEIAQENIDLLKDVDFAKYPVDVWIAKDTKTFSQFALSGTQDGTTFELRIATSYLDKKKDVEKPEDAKSILEAVGEAFGMGLEDSGALQSLEQLEEDTSGISL